MAVAPRDGGTGWRLQALGMLSGARLVRWGGVCALMLLGVSFAQAQSQPPRIGLVIGNSAYEKSSDGLPGARRDAERMKSALEHVGFHVTLLQNASKPEIESAIATFRAALREGGPQALGFIYFAGHGGSDAHHVDNYVLPTGGVSVPSRR